MPPQQLGDLDLREAILADQRVYDPGFLNLARPASSAVQSVNRRLRRSFIGFDPSRQEPIYRFQLPRRCQPFEAVNQFPAAFLLDDNDRRKLTVAFQRSAHAAFEFRNMQTVAAIGFPDLVQSKFPRFFFSPAQHGFSPSFEEERSQDNLLVRSPQPSLPLLWSRSI